MSRKTFRLVSPRILFDEKVFLIAMSRAAKNLPTACFLVKLRKGLTQAIQVNKRDLQCSEKAKDFSVSFIRRCLSLNM